MENENYVLLHNHHYFITHFHSIHESWRWIFSRVFEKSEHPRSDAFYSSLIRPMRNLEPHELSLIPPDLTPEEDHALGESLAKNGQIQDIVIYEGKILDGKHKYRHLIRLGIEPRFKEFIPNGVATAEDFVLAQLEGRHLTVGQRACVAAIIAKRNKKDPLANLKYDPTRVKRVGEDKLLKNNRHWKNRTVNKVAASMGLGSASAMKALVLLNNNKTLFNKVFNGRCSIEAAYQEHRRSMGSCKKMTQNTKVNLNAFKVDIKIPLCSAYDSEIDNFIKTMNAHGWICEMRLQDGKVYAHWFGNGYLSVGNNWSVIKPEFDRKRAIIVAANDKKDKL